MQNNNISFFSGPISLDSLENGSLVLISIQKTSYLHILLAVMSFVGGKNIIAPSERATQPEAEGMCAKQGLELMSLESLTQMDSVKDFLGDIGG